jgi:hypothetical protein
MNKLPVCRSLPSMYTAATQSTELQVMVRPTSKSAAVAGSTEERLLASVMRASWSRWAAAWLDCHCRALTPPTMGLAALGASAAAVFWRSERQDRRARRSCRTWSIARPAELKTATDGPSWEEKGTRGHWV